MTNRRGQKGWVDDRDPNGTGPMKKRKRINKWIGFWFIYTDGGKRRLRSKVLGLKSELGSKHNAEEALREHLKTVLAPDGTPVSVSPEPECEQRIKTLGDAANRYIEVMKPTWTFLHCRSVSSTIRSQIVRTLGDRAIESVTKSDCQYLMGQVTGEGGGLPSEASAKRVRTYLHAIFEMLVDDGLLARNPARKLKLPQCKEQIKIWLDATQVQSLWRKAKEKSTRDYLILRIGILLGPRPSELFALRANDISTEVRNGKPLRLLRFDETTVRSQKNMGGAPVKTKMKTRKSRASLPMPEDLYQQLAHYLSVENIRSSDEFLFPNVIGTPYDPDNYLDRVLQPLAKSAGIEHLTFRIVRRTRSTLFGDVNKGQIKDSQGLMRHNSPQMTLGVYQQPVEESLIDAVNKLNDALSIESEGKVETAA